MESREREHVQLLLQVARAYYLEDRSQNDIAELIGYSRSSVSRLLTEARDRKIVRFLIGHPLERQMALERALVERFGIRDARVADEIPDLSPLAAVALAGAESLIEWCGTATVLATSAGTTVDAVVDQLPTLSYRDLHVVQMIGALARGNPLADTPEITRRLAIRLGGDHRQMHAPLIVGTARVADALRHEEAVANALALASHADVALMGIGALTEKGHSGPIFNGWLTLAENTTLARLGAVGHMSGHHFDISGRHIVTDICERVMAVPLDRLSGIRTVIAVAIGPEKVPAIRGALRGGYVDVLVTDAATALAVLHLDSAELRAAG